MEDASPLGQLVALIPTANDVLDGRVERRLGQAYPCQLGVEQRPRQRTDEEANSH